jgi:hypothetical protein
MTKVGPWRTQARLRSKHREQRLENGRCGGSEEEWEKGVEETAQLFTDCFAAEFDDAKT